MSARMGWAAIVLDAGWYPGKPVNGGDSLCTVAKRSIGAVDAGPQMQVKLIDGLELGDLEEERATVR